MTILKKGTKIRVIDDNCGHGYPLDKILTFHSHFDEKGLSRIRVEEGHFYLFPEDIEIIKKK